MLPQLRLAVHAQSVARSCRAGAPHAEGGDERRLRETRRLTPRRGPRHGQFCGSPAILGDPPRRRAAPPRRAPRAPPGGADRWPTGSGSLRGRPPNGARRALLRAGERRRQTRGLPQPSARSAAARSFRRELAASFSSYTSRHGGGAGRERRVHGFTLRGGDDLSPSSTFAARPWEAC